MPGKFSTAVEKIQPLDVFVRKWSIYAIPTAGFGQLERPMVYATSQVPDSLAS